MALTPLPGGGYSYPADENPLGIQAFAPTQAGVSVPGYDAGNTAGSGLPGNTGSANAATTSSNDFWSGIEALTHGLTMPGLPQIPGEGLLTGAVNTGTGIYNAFTFITDIPRVTTTIVGLILIIVGLAALIRTPITINTVRGAAEAIAA